jgi:hypothetical protein
MQLKFFQEQVFFATVRIKVTEKAGVGDSIGTGFLYRVPVSDDQNCILLISNKHVYGDGKSAIQLIFHKQDPADPNRPSLGETVILEGTAFESVLTVHPDQSVDLACLNVSSIGSQPIFSKQITDDLMPDFEHERLLPGNDVWFVGYPENRFDTRNNLPILRRGYIASIPKVDFEGRREFLIDAQVFPGSSGSPVFSALGDKFMLVGVVSQTMIKNERLQTVPAAQALAVTQTLGLGIVLKSTLLRELLETATREIKNRLANAQPVPTQDTQESEQRDAVKSPATPNTSP